MKKVNMIRLDWFLDVAYWQVSYPKCGRTWLNTMIAQTLWKLYCVESFHHYMLDLDKISYAFPQYLKSLEIPHIRTIHDESDLALSYRSFLNRRADVFGGKGSFVLEFPGSSEGMEAITGLVDAVKDTIDVDVLERLLNIVRIKLQDSSILFIKREIKDVLVSFYFHQAKRNGRFSGTIQEFVRDDVWGAKKTIAFWNHWYGKAPNAKRFLLVSYEDLMDKTKEVYLEVIDYLGLAVEDRVAEEVIRGTSFDNMKKAEREARWDFAAPKEFDANDDETYKVRRGKVGGYVDYLDKSDIDYIDNLVRDVGCPFAGTPYNSEWENDILG